MTTSTLIFLGFTGGLMLVAGWGFHWHLAALRMVTARAAIAKESGDVHLLPLVVNNTLRYRYRLIIHPGDAASVLPGDPRRWRQRSFIGSKSSKNATSVRARTSGPARHGRRRSCAYVP